MWKIHARSAHAARVMRTNGAEERTRTFTLLRGLAPEACGFGAQNSSELISPTGTLVSSSPNGSLWRRYHPGVAARAGRLGTTAWHAGRCRWLGRHPLRSGCRARRRLHLLAPIPAGHETYEDRQHHPKLVECSP